MSKKQIVRKHEREHLQKQSRVEERQGASHRTKEDQPGQLRAGRTNRSLEPLLSHCFTVKSAGEAKLRTAPATAHPSAAPHGRYKSVNINAVQNSFESGCWRGILTRCSWPICPKLEQSVSISNLRSR
jgi:hypothetical protein